MTELSGNDLYKHLDTLCSELNKKKSSVDMNSFAYAAHSQMDLILGAEKQYLEESNPNLVTIPKLNFSMTGFPTAQSLGTDLERMCMEHETSGKMALYRRDGNLDMFDRKNYTVVSQKDWEKKFLSRSKDRTMKKKTFFAISETEDVFKLSLAECFYMPGVDKFSQTIPVLIMSGTADYRLAWDSLFTKDSASYLVLNDEMAKSQASLVKPVKSKKYYDDINERYKSSREDFTGLDFFKNMFLRWSSGSINYKAFLDSGHATRVEKANAILDVLERNYDEKLMLSHDDMILNRENLGDILRFDSLVDKKDAKKVSEDTYWDNHLGRVYLSKKTFDIIYSNGGSNARKVGTLTVMAPHKHYTVTLGTFFSLEETPIFKKGWMDICVSGTSIENDEQYKKIKSELGKLYT